jgi:CRISPR-associated protein Csb2
VPEISPTLLRWRLDGGELPSITQALPVGEAVRRAALGCAAQVLNGRLPPALSGHDMPAQNPYRHAFYLAEDTDRDGNIDHIALYAPSGLDGPMRTAFANFRPVLPVGARQRGSGCVLAPEASPLFARARHWISVTPYLPPWHYKSNRPTGPIAQLLRELTLRSIAQPHSVAILPYLELAGRQFFASDFSRRYKCRFAPMLPGWFLRLSFAEPVGGPLAFGYGCNVGLGLFVAVDC